MKKILLTQLFVFFFNASALLPQTSGEIILKADDLKYLSVRRLSDIYSILPQLDIYTIDRYRHSSLSGNLFKNTPSDIHVLINGVKTNFSLWDKVNLSQFPLVQNNIDSIVIKYYPGVYLGEYSSGILIDIITKNPPAGVSLNLEYSTGNEIGDPGPYRYTEYFSHNVDQFGPNTSFCASYGSNTFNFNFNFIDQVSPSTDPAILMRTNNFVFQNYQVRFSGLSMNVSGKSFLGTHNLFSAYTKTGHPLIGSVYGADLYFIDHLGKEIPIEDECFYLTSGNNFSIGKNDKLILDLSFKKSKTYESIFLNDLDVKADDILFYSKLGFSSLIGPIKYFSGISFEHQNYKGIDENIHNQNTIGSFFTSLSFGSIDRLSHSIDVYFRDEKSEFGFFTNLSNQFVIDDQNLLKFSLSAGSLFNIDNSIDQRAKNGISIINNYSAYPRFEESNPMFYQINLDYRYQPSLLTIMNTGVNFFYEFGLDYVRNNFSFNSQNKSIENIGCEIFNNLKGARGEFYLVITHKLSSLFEYRFYYRYKNCLSGNSIYEQVIKRIPEHKIFFSLYYSPYQDLYGSINLAYISSSEWIEYRNISSTPKDLYRKTLPENILVNCTLVKKFWNERIKVSAIVENLLNNRIQYHPIGSNMDLTFFLRIEANFESLIEI